MTYSGDGENTGSSSAAVTLYGGATPPPPSIALAATPSATVTQGAAVAVTATVTQTAATSGIVSFLDGKTPIGSASLVATGSSGGTATLRFVPSTGSHSITASLAATLAAPSATSAPLMLSVTGLAASSAVLSSSGSPGSYTLSAQITGFGPQRPSGEVSFLDETNANAVLGTAKIDPTQTTAGLVSLNGAQLPDGSDPVLADFNKDGIPDLAVCGDTEGLNLYSGKGDGTFSATATSVMQSGCSSMVTGDLNQDGNIDIVLPTQILLGNGDGTFQPPLSYSGGSPIALADMNRDGVLDIVAVAGSAVGVLLGKGDGTFQAPLYYPPAGEATTALAVADLNGDGVPDVAVTSVAIDTLTEGTVGTSGLAMYFGNGDGSLAAPVQYKTGAGPNSVAAGDFNGDGIIDLAVVDGYTGSAPFVVRDESNCTGTNNCNVVVYLGKGNGVFDQPSDSALTSNPYNVGEFPSSAQVLDVNKDGLLDIVLQAESTDLSTGELQILFGKGDGTFQTASSYEIHGGIFATADLNGDGLTDFVADGGPIVVVLGDWSASATLSNVSVPGTGSTHQAIASYSGDTIYNPSTSTAVGLVSSVAAPDFSLSVSATSLTIKQGQSGTATLTLTPIGGFNQAVTFACSGLPSEVSCSFSPATVTPNGAPVTSQLTITTTAPASALLHRSNPLRERGNWGRGSLALALLIGAFAGTRASQGCRTSFAR